MTKNLSGHYARALWNSKLIDKAIAQTKLKLKKVKYDCFIGRGLSGIMAAHLAHALGKELVIVRKPKERNHVQLVEGFNSFKNGIIVDDFISSGNTMDAIFDEVDVNKIHCILLYEAGRSTVKTYNKVPVVRLTLY